MKKSIQILLSSFFIALCNGQALFAVPTKTTVPPVDESGRTLTCPACDSNTIILNEDFCPANLVLTKPSSTIPAKDSSLIACPTSICGSGSLLPPGASMNLYISGSNTAELINLSSVQSGKISGDYFLFSAPIFLKASSIAWIKLTSGSKNLCAGISGTLIDNASLASGNSAPSTTSGSGCILVENSNLSGNFSGQLVSIILLLGALFVVLGLRRCAFQKTKSPK